MNPTFKNILAVVIGVFIGMIVNGGLISLGHSVIALPEGADVSTYEKLKESMHMFGSEQYIFPFLAHSLGTLVGAFVAALMAATYKMRIAVGIGVFFLIAGIINCFLLPAPVWFIIIDILAYVPAGYLGWKLAGSK